VPGASVAPRSGSAVAIGNFDGVHVGHRKLVERAIGAARRLGLRSVVLTFDRHPATIVRPESAPRLLTSVERKLDLLRATGVDEVVVLRFDEVRAAESAEDFVETVLVGQLAARVVVVGASFRFGNRQRGDVSLLETMGRTLGFSVDRLDLVAGDATDGSAPVSSSRIRALVSSGHVAEAARLLGRPHEIVVARSVGDLRHAGPIGGGGGGGGGGDTTQLFAVGAELLLPSPGRYVVDVAALATGAQRVPSRRASALVPESGGAVWLDGDGVADGGAGRDATGSTGDRLVIGFLAAIEAHGVGEQDDRTAAGAPRGASAATER